MKNKRGIDHEWKLVKYIGDIAIYAECKCGYHYACSKELRNEDGSWSFKQIPTIFYPYCPCCGACKKRHSAEIEKLNIEFPWERKKFGVIYDMSDYFLRKGENT